MSTRPILHFYQVSSKYFKRYSSYITDKKFYIDADTDANGIRPQNNMSPHTLVGVGVGWGDDITRQLIFDTSTGSIMNMFDFVRIC